MRRYNKEIRLVYEEQSNLDKLIDQMAEVENQLDDKLQKYVNEAKRAREHDLPEAYGMFMDARKKKNDVIKDKRKLKKTRDELYEYRIKALVEDEDGTVEEEEYLIGLHEYSNINKTFVYTWKMPVFRHFLMDNASEVYEGVVKDKHGKEYCTTFNLLLKRKIDLLYTQVNNVNHFFPVSSGEEEKIIYDEFLQELIDRRSEQEFKNIVFSIQKKQGEIIQTKFEQDMIVQGCAGSGKSMIMLHRLPILLYDNPNSIDKNNIYIITPSLTYMQMAENMREQLEIADLKMGTVNQYYDYCIQKYGRDKSEYGVIDKSIGLPYEQVMYVYSKECLEDIRTYMKEAVKTTEYDYASVLKVFNLERKNDSKSIFQLLTSRFIDSQKIIDKNNEYLREYYNAIKECLIEANEFKDFLYSRKSTILRAIARKRSSEEERINRFKKEIDNLDTKRNARAIKNLEEIIADAFVSIESFNKAKDMVDNDTIYFEKLGSVSRLLDFLESQFSGLNTQLDLPIYETKPVKADADKTSKDTSPNLSKNNPQNNPIRFNYKKIYEYIPKISTIIGIFYAISYELSRIEEKYIEYSSFLHVKFDKFRNKVNKLEGIKSPLILAREYKEIVELNKNSKRLSESLPIICYHKIMEKLGYKPNEADKLKALTCSPYLYLQILYQFQGPPNAVKESLITIDEAQDLAPQEISLLKKINDDQVILNLFGDENQHIKGTKGIEIWSEVSHIADFTNYSLMENYRNAKQVTEYCNKRFSMSMRAINHDGSGVTDLKDFDQFWLEMIELLSEDKKQGLRAIIVNNAEEANYISKEFSDFKNAIHDLTKDNFEVDRTRWNLVTVKNSKGLEFNTVIAVSGNMTENEKYITYTRALDRLIVYDQPLVLPVKQ